LVLSHHGGNAITAPSVIVLNFFAPVAAASVAGVTAHSIRVAKLPFCYRAAILAFLLATLELLAEATLLETLYGVEIRGEIWWLRWL
jgi:hypothetical protein